MARDRENVVLALATTLIGVGSTVLIFKATTRGEVYWWTDPIFWIGAAGLAAGAGIFVWLLVPPWVTDRNTRRVRKEQIEQEGRANQRQGLHEVVYELQGISRQLKAELRWGKRGGHFPNNAWTKYQHLIVGDEHALVESAYEQTYSLGLATLSAKQEELDEAETQERQEVKKTVDAAIEVVRHLRDEVEP